MRVRFDKEKREWLRLSPEDERTDMDISIDAKLFDVLIAVKKDLRRELDHAMLVGGMVGAGKSNAARIMCRIVSDESFHPNTHVIRDVNDIKRVIRDAKPGEGIIFDEGSGIFSATDTMTKKTKYANYVLDVCRQKFLFICIVAPEIHRLTSKIAIDRTKTMVRVYMDNKTGKRGKFAFYGSSLKEKMYRHAKKNYGIIKGCKCKFRGTIGIDKTFTDEYKKVKDETLNLALDSFGPKDKDKPKQPSPRDIERQIIKDFIKRNPHMEREEQAKALGKSRSTIQRIVREIQKEDLALQTQQKPLISW